MSAPLLLDNAPGQLVFGYVVGEGWIKSLDYRSADDVLTAWPAAPVLVFDEAVVGSVTAVLSNGNTRATWTIPASLISILHASEKKRVRLQVTGQTWFSGAVGARA